MRHSLVNAIVECHDGDFFFHLVLTDDGRPVKMRLAGWWGKPDSTDVQPFILKPDGRMDFGVAPDDDLEYLREGRYGTTDLLDRQVFVGREVSIKVDDADYYLKVTTIEELVGTGPKAKLPA
jgi:hypothetical protein